MTVIIVLMLLVITGRMIIGGPGFMDTMVAITGLRRTERQVDFTAHNRAGTVEADLAMTTVDMVDKPTRDYWDLFWTGAVVC